MSLTDTRIKTAKPAEKIYKVYDADGLYIEVPPSGSKRWRFKYRLDGKEKRISLGTYPEIGLRAARDRRDMARRLVAEGFVLDFRLYPKTSRASFTVKPYGRLPKSGFPSLSIHGSRATPEQSESVWTSMSMMCSAVCPFRTLRRRTS